MSKVYIKVHFKDTYKHFITGNINNVKYWTETIEVKKDIGKAEAKANAIKNTCGTSVLDGIECIREFIGQDVVEEEDIKLTKDQMFDFILENKCSIIPDGSTWQKTNGTKIKKQYTVSINNTHMSGFDLEDAINYYVNNRKNMK